jgi:hypothetical protein
LVSFGVGFLGQLPKVFFSSWGPVYSFGIFSNLSLLISKYVHALLQYMDSRVNNH